MTTARCLLLCAAALTLATDVPAQTPDPTLAADVDSFVRHIMGVAGIPGLSIAVVQGDRAVLVKGYGFADLERRIPATETTAFYIASETKAFTALTVMLMADRKTLDLDAPITRYLRDAQWAPTVHPDSITLRQLLSHTSGIDNSGPVVWRTALTGVHTNPQLKQLLQYHGASGVGHAYRYTNVGYNIAGLIIDDVTRGKWQDALATSVFRPIGMTGTTAYLSRVDSARRAMPYVMEPAGPRRVYYAKADGNMQAAGGLVSTAADMAKWLEIQMNEGRLAGRQVFPASVLAETHRQQVPVWEQHGEMPITGYALGWMISAQGNDTLLTHGGGFSAFQTQIAFDPRRKIGVAVMTNESKVGGGAIGLIAQYVIDRARDSAAARQKYAARLPELPAIVERIKARIGADLAQRAARPQTLRNPLAAYAGTYESPQGGTLTWTVRDGRLWAEIGVLRSVAEVFDAAKDQLRIELEPGSGEVVQFTFSGARATSVKLGAWEYTLISSR